MASAVTFQLNTISIKVVKGNELAELITETHGAGEFQLLMADGRDRNKGIRVQKTVSALGARGDYIELVCDVTYSASGSTSDQGVPAEGNGLMVDVIDFTGVPVQVQHGGFGKYSPFDTPHELISKELARGIDKQLLTVVPDNCPQYADIAVMSTAKSQTVRGSTDGRITVYCDEAAVAAVTKVYLKLKPNADGVFVIPAGALLWGRPNPIVASNLYFGDIYSS